MLFCWTDASLFCPFLMQSSAPGVAKLGSLKLLQLLAAVLIKLRAAISIKLPADQP